MKTQITNNFRTKIFENLPDYYANSINGEQLIKEAGIEINRDQQNRINDILGQSELDWEALSCDADGATAAQDAAMDEFMWKVTDEICEYL